MANTTTHSAHGGHGSNYLNHSSGLWSWLSTLDHKRIGIMYLYSILTFFLAGGIFALLIRLNLFFPAAAGHKFALDPNTYNKFFTYHGAIMVFLVIIPSIPAAIGNFVLPMMLGAKDVAFPRLNLASYYIYMAGAMFALAALFFGGADTGWTFYTPYSISTSGAVIMVVFGAFIAGFSKYSSRKSVIFATNESRSMGRTVDGPLLWTTSLASSTSSS